MNAPTCRSFAALVTVSSAFLLVGASGCRTSPKAKVDARAPTDRDLAEVHVDTTPRDAHSFARPEIARVKHVSLELDVDFETQTIGGAATLSLARAPGAAEVILDQRALEIESIVDDTGGALTFQIGKEEKLLGAPLTIALGPTTSKITVRYRTRPGADALQFLAPVQTAGKRKPFLFTQGQAILTRTWIPLQDSPGIRVTYDARISTRADLVALMSAEQKPSPGEATDAKTKTFSFEMPEAIPPYLIALAVGDLAFKSTGPRSGVWAEPSVVDAAAWEFADTEKMMAVTEALYGAYRWGRYDILVLPPSFPFGGMENPRLTFLSPTVIAGDRTLVSIIAHELAHSWSGNLVTNRTWDDLWLNEGFTSYIELRIMEAVYDKDRASLVEALGRRELLKVVKRDGVTSEKTRMRRDIGDEDPDDAISTIAYDKGSAFLRMLELKLGREKLDGFLRAYFDRNAFSPMTTVELLAQIRVELVREDATLESQLRLDEWCYGTGLPENLPAVASPRLAQIESEAKKLDATKDVAAAAAAIDPEKRRFDWVLLLQSLPRTQPASLLLDLDKTLSARSSKNNEIRFEWLKLVVANNYTQGFDSLRGFLASIGRRRLIRPLYTELMTTDWGRPIAQEVYDATRPTYHPLTQTTLDAIVHPPIASLEARPH